MRLDIARLGVFHPIETYRRRFTEGKNCFSLFAQEVLQHAGLSYHFVKPRTISPSVTDVLLIPDASLVEREDVPEIIDFVRAGGTVIQFGGAGALGNRLGLFTLRQLPSGYASLPDEQNNPEPLRFLGAKSLVVGDREDAHWQLDWKSSGELRYGPHGSALQAVFYEAAFVRGRAIVCAVDVFGTMVLLQQGDQPVTEDGMPAPDGTAPLDDGILKAEDTLQQDWEWDRRFTPSGGAYFALPYCDLWREAVVRLIVNASLKQGYTVPILGYLPAGISAVAHLSHDSDHNIDESAETTLKLLEPFGVTSTWCMIEPGYSSYIYDRVRAAGHELAFHYNAMEDQGGKWREAEFKRQFSWLREATGLEEVTSNKNHYTRFEGWGELFAWCEDVGIEVDQTRGPSKGGNRGFVFGTCHPYRPIALFDEENRLYNVLEIGFLTQDLDLSDYWGRSDIMYPLLAQVERVGGVAHFLFHQVHIHNNESVRKAIKSLFHETMRRGIPWWTTKRINEWERARRTVHIEGVDRAEADDVVGEVVKATDGSSAIKIVSAAELKQAVVYIPVKGDARLGDTTEEANSGSAIVMYRGIPCQRLVVDLVPGEKTVKLDAF
ncbi:hypothetical protein [Numidum massiliense]|uniref:hypothetical protein n=1 Tax=Numidum massiliense TaxID=1522315 RepID=UPI0006D5A477|nr:hypothetical protein [Numidum massiliense]